MGRGGGGKHKGGGATDKAAPLVQEEEEPSVCPLCIEVLDATEQEFYPCPCGYQVCLFCYGRLKNECARLCPGCRTPYDDAKIQQGGRRPRRAVEVAPSSRLSAAAPAVEAKPPAIPAPATAASAAEQAGGAQSRSATPSGSTTAPASAISRPAHAKPAVATAAAPGAAPRRASVQLSWAAQAAAPPLPPVERASSAGERPSLEATRAPPSGESAAASAAGGSADAWPSLAASSVAVQRQASAGSPSLREEHRPLPQLLQQLSSVAPPATSPQPALQPAAAALDAPSPFGLYAQQRYASGAAPDGGGGAATPVAHAFDWLPRASGAAHPQHLHGAAAVRAALRGAAAPPSCRQPVPVPLLRDALGQLGQPDPAGLALLARVQAAMREGQISMRDATLALVKFLRQHEAGSGGGDGRPLAPPPGFGSGAQAARAPPPGFGGGPGESGAASGLLGGSTEPATAGGWGCADGGVGASIWAERVPGGLHSLWATDAAAAGAGPADDPPARPPGRVPLYARGASGSDADKGGDTAPQQSRLASRYLNGGLGSLNGGGRDTPSQLPLDASPWPPVDGSPWPTGTG